MRSVLICALLAPLFLLAACSAKPAATRTIESGMAGVPAIQVEVLKAGTGPQAKRGDSVNMHYVGRFTDGRKFDSSRDSGSPFTYQIGVTSVITGWHLIGAEMRVGDRWKCTIPPKLAYDQGGNGIPPNATLVFDMELMGINP